MKSIFEKIPKFEWRTGWAGVWGAAATFAGRLLGLASSVAIASSFGAKSDTDMFYFALGALALASSLITCVFSSTFIPLYIKLRTEAGDKESSSFAGMVLLVSFIAGSVFSLGVAIFHKPFLRVASGFGADVISESGYLFEGVVLFLVPLLALEFGAALLSAGRHFLLPALHPLISSMALLFSVLILSDGLRSDALLIGIWSGGLLNCICLLGACVFHGRLGMPRSSSVSRGIDLARISAPIMGAQVFSFAYLYLMRYLASRLEEGTVTALNYAETLAAAPVLGLAMPLANAIYPKLCEFKAKNDMSGLRDFYVMAQRGMALIIAPAALFCIAFAWPLVHLLYRHGKFSFEAADNAAFALTLYSLGIAGLSIVALNGRASISGADSKLVSLGAITSIGGSILGVLLQVGLFWHLGMPGIPSGRVIEASLWSGGFGFVFAWMALGGFDRLRVARGIVFHYTVASLASIPGLLLCNALGRGFSGLLLGTGLFLVLYAAAQFGYKTPEFKLVLSMLRQGIMFIKDSTS